MASSFLHAVEIALFRRIAAIYVFLFGRPSAQRANNAILQLAFKARGYNNCCDPKSTGEAKFIQIFSRFNPRLCVDIGANVGDYSRYLLTHTSARVIAFEPLPKAFQKLSTLKQLFPNRIDAVNVGVGAQAATLELHYGDEDSELATFSAEVNQVHYVGAHNVNTMMVPVITLDEYRNQHLNADNSPIDLLKIDAEGFEYEILLGAQATITAHPPKFIQIEYNWHQLFRAQTLKKLSEMMPAYSAYQLLPHGSGMVKRDLNRPDSNIFHYANFIFVHASVEPSLRALL